MKKIIFGNLIFVLLLSLCFSFVKVESVSAQISGSDDFNPSVTHLITKVRNGKNSYFSSFVQAGLTDTHYGYRDTTGTQVNNYVIKNKTTDKFSDKKSIVTSEVFSLSDDFKKLAEAASLYVSGSAGHLALSTDDRDKITFSLIVNGDSTETQTATGNRVYSSGAYSPLWVETEKILLQSDSTFQFNFESQKGYGQDNSKGFMIFDPCLNYSVEIDSIQTDVTGGEVFRGQEIYLSATNAVLELAGGETIEYFKNIFQIEWEVTKGKNSIDKTALSNGYLKVNSNATADITVRARCKKSSDSNEYIYSTPITFKINGANSGVSVTSNFEEGIESYSYSQSGSAYNVSVSIKEGYVPVDTTNFNSTTRILTLTNVEAKSIVEVNLKKQISVKEIVVSTKAYDGTTDARIKEIIFNETTDGTVGIVGLNEQSGVYAEFASSNAGTTSVNVYGTIALTSETLEKYVLVEKSLSSIPVTGEILKRDVTVSANYTTQEIGLEEKEITFETTGVVSGETINGKLTKESGTSVGEYRITIGNLVEQNPNYNITFISNVYEITKTIFKITNVEIEKVYDGELTISSVPLSCLTFQVKDGNSYKDANWETDIKRGKDVGLRITASFVGNANVGTNKQVDFVVELIGTDKADFELESVPSSVVGTIVKAPLTVSADEIEKQFGENDPTLTYSITSGNLFKTDALTGSLSREQGKDVGEYAITQGSLTAGANYNLTFVGNTFKITRRQVGVNALYSSKQYGNSDPQLTYELVSGSEVEEGLNLNLKRSERELVGTYEISVESYNSKNYEIVSFSQEGFEILKRDITIIVQSKEKEYDGTDYAEVVYEIQNLQNNNPDNIRLEISARFQGTTVKEWGITYYNNGSAIVDFTEDVVLGNNVNCYNISFDVNYSANIKIRKIYICVANGKITKEWGDPDPNPLPYTIENGFDGISLTGELERELTGQDADGYTVKNNEVGVYPLSLGTLINDINNQYFEISFKEDGYCFEILKRKVIIYAENTTKVYGDDDPEFEFELDSTVSLPEGIELSDVLNNGKLGRSEGESVGKYNYTLGSLRIASTLAKNYELFLTSGHLGIVARDIEIQIDNKSKEYGDENPKFTFTIVSGSIGFEGDLIIVSDGNENVGQHELEAIINSDNYNLTANKAYLTITKAPLVIASNPAHKEYGENEPTLTIFLESGELKFDDTLQDVLSGEVKRMAGEDVGTYAIVQNTLRVSDNYELTFHGSNLTITKRTAYVVADPISRFLDEIDDPYDLTYSVSNLLEGDSLSGALKVNPTGVGEFEIKIGTLSNSNYEIDYTSAIFKVSKRKLQIVIITVMRDYDSTTETGTLEYGFGEESQIKEGHRGSYFGIKLSCTLKKDVGYYPITATYSSAVDEFYDVEITNDLGYGFNYGFYIISEKVIEITAKDVELTYGDQIPSESELEFTIKKGKIYNDEIVIKLKYEEEINGVGEYKIVDNTITTKNYSINCNFGTLKINQKQIKVQISNFEKTYGNPDPEFSYSFEDGAVVEGDVISGGITREQGEKVGTYNLICGLENPNYEIIMDETKLEIKQRELLVIISAKDKVYDGTKDVETSYVIQNKVEGDDVDIIYSAEFANSNISNNNRVNIISSKLMGTDKENYTYKIQEPITAEITHKSLTKDGVTITVEDDNTSLVFGTYLKIEFLLADEIGSIGRDKNTESGILINLYNRNNELLTNFGKVKVTIVSDEFPYSDYGIYLLNEDGTTEKMNHEETVSNVTFETTKLGTFVAATDKNVALIYFLIALGSAVGVGAIITGIVVGVKKSKGKL